MKQILFKGFLTASVAALLFIFLTPISFFFDNHGPIVLVESLIVVIILLATFFKILRLKYPKVETEEEEEKFDKQRKRAERKPYIFALIAWIVFGIIIYFGQEQRFVNQIKKEGVFTFGRVNNGKHSSSRSRRGGRTDTYTITLTYIDQHTDKKFSPETEVSEEEYNNLEVNQNIQVVYLKSNPKVFRIILTKEELSKYSSMKPNSLKLENIEHLSKNLKMKKVIPYLNKISLGWGYMINTDGVFFENEFEDEQLILYHDGIITYEGKGLKSITKEMTATTIDMEEEDPDAPTKTIATYTYKDWIVLERSKLATVNEELATNYYLLFYAK